MARSHRKNYLHRKKYSYRKRKQKRTPFPLILLTGALLLAGFFSVIFAKYAHQETKTDLVAASQFYFTSDLLTESGKTYTLNPGTTTLEVQLRNYADDLRWTEKDIEFSYSLKKDGEDTKTQTGNGEIKVVSTADKNANNTNSSTNSENGTESNVNTDGRASAVLKIEKLEAGTYDLTVTSIKPFTKTLKGTFSIPEESTAVTYSISDSAGSAYALLTVSTANYKGSINISWPAGVVPDSTQADFSSKDPATTWDSSNSSYKAGSGTIAVTSNSSYTYRFFKMDTSQDYSGATNGFKVEKTN